MSILGLVVMGVVPKNLLWNKIFITNLFILVYIIFINSISMLFFNLVKQFFASMIITMFGFVTLISPLITMISYSRIGGNYSDLRDYQKMARVQARLYYGIQFNNLINKNKDYNFLTNSFHELANDQANWYSYKSNYLIGDMIGIDSQGQGFENTIQVIKNKSNTLKYIDLLKKINTITKKINLNNCGVNNTSFIINSDLERKYFKINDCSFEKYIDLLIEQNIDNGIYNDLFYFLKKNSNDIRVFNEVSKEFPSGRTGYGGEIFKYNHYNGRVNYLYIEKNYSNPFVLEISWLINSFIKYSQSLDNETIEYLQESKFIALNKKSKLNILLNPITQFALMSMGQNSGGFLDDVFNLSQNFITVYNNMYYTFEINEYIKQLSPKEELNDFRFKTFENKSEVEIINLKIHKNSIIELMYFSYFLTSCIILWISFLIYKKRLIY